MLSFPAPIDILGSLSSLYPCIINIRDNLKSRHLQAYMVAIMRQERYSPMDGCCSYPSITRLKAAAIPLAMGVDFRPHICQFVIVGYNEKPAQEVDNLLSLPAPCSGLKISQISDDLQLFHFFVCAPAAHRDPSSASIPLLPLPDDHRLLSLDLIYQFLFAGTIISTA